MITTFTTSMVGIAEDDRPAAVDELAGALHVEFPAFRVARYAVLADRAVLQVTAAHGTPHHAAERLDGWGRGRLTVHRSAVEMTAHCHDRFRGSS